MNVSGHDTLIGYSALTRSVSPKDKVDLISEQSRHRHSNVDNVILGRYLRMDKVLVGKKGANDLLQMADKLCNDGSRAPYVQYARSWMLIEASLASGEFLSTQDRVELLSDATVTINDAIRLALSNSGQKKTRYNDNIIRMSLAMAHIPLIKSIVNGDVDEHTQNLVKLDTISIAGEYIKHTPVKRRSGLAHEMVTLCLLHAIGDPKYVSIPSTLRGDNGIYNKSQTRDISVIKQHFGEIRQVQPIEVKSHINDLHRSSYWPTLLSGKDILERPDGSMQTHAMILGALKAMHEKRGREVQIEMIAHAMGRLVSKLAEYKATGRPKEGRRMHTKTRFYGAKQPRVTENIAA